MRQTATTPLKAHGLWKFRVYNNKDKQLARASILAYMYWRIIEHRRGKSPACTYACVILYCTRVRLLEFIEHLNRMDHLIQVYTLEVQFYIHEHNASSALSPKKEWRLNSNSRAHVRAHMHAADCNHTTKSTWFVEISSI